jgi:lipoprotein-anchoring transpeptidase ErfK/SrfK
MAGVAAVGIAVSAGAPALAPALPSGSLDVAVTTTTTLTSSNALVAVVYKRIAVYNLPNGRVISHMSAFTGFGSRRVLLTTAQRSDGWLQVELPVRPNGTKAWIRRSDVVTTTNRMRIVIDRTAHTLSLFRSGVRIARWPAAVGKPSTPTPRGLYYVTDKIVLTTNGAYGPYALALSGYSPVFTTFAGGDGEVGIHGTDVDSSVGHPVTHGCIRLHNYDIPKLYRAIAIGAPVQIR